jgi:outer membrane protein insertion porin family
VQIKADKSSLEPTASSGNIARFGGLASVNYQLSHLMRRSSASRRSELSGVLHGCLIFAVVFPFFSGCKTAGQPSVAIPALPDHIFHLESHHEGSETPSQPRFRAVAGASEYRFSDQQPPRQEPEETENPYLIRYQSSDDRANPGLLGRLDRPRSPAPYVGNPVPPPINEKKMLTMADLAKDQDSRSIEPGQVVSEIVIEGNKRLPYHHLTRNMGTRPGRYFDPDRLQEDVDKLWRMPEISRINGPFIENTPEGVKITLEIVERNLINEVKFIGNRELTDRKLRKECGLEEGIPLDVYQIRSAKARIEELYKSKGFPRTQVEVLEGGEAGDSSVIFLIHEDQKQRIWKSEFEGNTIASDARLQSLIEAKPGILKLFGGLVKRDEIERDILTLTNYYRSLGFFNARIGREVQESNDGRWITIRFIIHEGPRYKVRNVMFWGNQVFESDQLVRLTKLKPEEDKMPEFNVAKMNADVVALRDLYGGNGYVFADVEAEPRFLEEPGLLDIVYKINEGKQYRVGDVNVYFEGNYGVTRREVVLNRLSLRPGDLIDVREIRNSERRLGAAQIFADPTVGSPGPKIVVRPPELKELERHAQQGKQLY